MLTRKTAVLCALEKDLMKSFNRFLSMLEIIIFNNKIGQFDLFLICPLMVHSGLNFLKGGLISFLKSLYLFI